MERRRLLFLTVIGCALLAALVTAGFTYYVHCYLEYTKQVFSTRLTNIGYLYPIPADTRWSIPDHIEANYPQTIIGYEPQLFLRTREQGGYEIFFYANPERAGVCYAVRVFELSSRKFVEYDDQGKLLKTRPLSDGEALWDSQSTRLPLQKARPLISLSGNHHASYVIRVEIVDQASEKLIAQGDYLVIGNRHP